MTENKTYAVLVGDGQSASQTVASNLTKEAARAAYDDLLPELAVGEIAALYYVDRRGDWHLEVRSDLDGDRGPCEWFARCVRPADGVVAHPVLGDVPTCQVCAARFDLALR